MQNKEKCKLGPFRSYIGIYWKLSHSNIEAKSPQSADNIQSAISSYCNELVKKYQSQNAEEYDRTRGYVIRRIRNYFILTISDSTRSGNQLIDTFTFTRLPV